MSKYVLSKITFAFFGTATVVIFILLLLGAFVSRVGSIEIAIVIYAINTTCLVVSTLWYVWEKAHKDQPKHRELEILEAAAKRELQGREIKPGTESPRIDKPRANK